MDVKIMLTEEGDIQVNTETLAAFFGVSRRTLTNWTKDGCPKLDRGWWSLRDVMTWRESQGKGADQLDEEGDLKKRKLKAEIGLKEAQRDYADLKKQIINGDYLERAEVVTELKRFMVTFKRAAMGIPRVVSAQIGLSVEPETVRRIESQLSKTINDILREMSEDGTFTKKRK